MAFFYYMENVFDTKHHLSCSSPFTMSNFARLRRYLKQESNSKEQGPNKAKHKK